MLKSVGRSGRLTLGKRYAGRCFEVEERANGELLLRPVKVSRGTGFDEALTRPDFEIAEVERIILPSREARSSRR